MGEKKMRCPKCRSTKLVKWGKTVSRHKMVQRWLCKNCLYSTVYPFGKKGKK